KSRGGGKASRVAISRPCRKGDRKSSMSKLRLSFSCWGYDRTRALVDGSVAPEGIDLNCLTNVVEETFFRMARNREFEIAEMSLSSYCVSLSRPERPFIAIPVFPSRMFRHGFTFVSAKSGIKEPKDLAGKRIGTPEYQLTAPVWIRGILQDEYGVDPASPDYFTGGLFEPRREDHAEPAREIPRPHHPDGKDALRYDRGGRDRRHSGAASPLDLL